MNVGNNRAAARDIELPKREPPPLRCTALFIGGWMCEMNPDLVAEWKTKPKTLYATLYELLEAWQESYCYTADDGGQVEVAIVNHARCMLAMPDASLEEMLDWVLHNS